MTTATKALADRSSSVTAYPERVVSDFRRTCEYDGGGVQAETRAGACNRGEQQAVTMAHRTIEHDTQRSVGPVKRRLAVAGALAGMLFALTPADAVTVFQRSVYTTIELAGCTKTKSHADGDAYLCNGLPGYPIYLAEGDLRAFVSAGTAPQTARAATQTLRPFNTPFRTGSQRATLEWRIVLRDGKQVPYAAIMRFFTSDDARRGEVLVVTKVAGAEACHVAYVDALANPEAIVIARQIADDRARAFDCRTAPEVVGARGKSPL